MKNYLLEQFNSTYDQKAWTVGLKDAIIGLTEEQARQKVKEDVNSIYEIVTHLVFWNEWYLHKFNNEKLAEVENNDTTFQDTDNMTWDELLRKADIVFSQWQDELEKPMDAPVEGKKEDRSTIACHINVHNAYHIGQIVIIRKMQGNWDKANGVS